MLKTAHLAIPSFFIVELTATAALAVLLFDRVHTAACCICTTLQENHSTKLLPLLLLRCCLLLQWAWW
jgi:hypothetical protein